MKITYDPNKNARNIRERDLDFERAYDFVWDDAIVYEDTRYPYPEIRYLAYGYMDSRLHVLCFCETEEGIRVISFRKATRREAKTSGKVITLY